MCKQWSVEYASFSSCLDLNAFNFKTKNQIKSFMCKIFNLENVFTDNVFDSGSAIRNSVLYSM